MFPLNKGKLRKVCFIFIYFQSKLQQKFDLNIYFQEARIQNKEANETSARRAIKFAKIVESEKKKTEGGSVTFSRERRDVADVVSIFNRARNKPFTQSQSAFTPFFCLCNAKQWNNSLINKAHVAKFASPKYFTFKKLSIHDYRSPGNTCIMVSFANKRGQLRSRSKLLIIPSVFFFTNFDTNLHYSDNVSRFTIRLAVPVPA